MKREKFIKIRATEDEQARANRVAKAVGKDLSAILRAAMDRLAKKHGVYDVGEP